jgi:glycosyltransferase involved in cell wall biosynthesis
MPKVSVCIPSYNGARYLGETIESVLAQDSSDYELVICDNASTDDTPRVARSFPDRRVRYVRFDAFVSQSANWDRCLDLAAGDYVVLLHADDLVRPGFLRRALAVLDAHRDVALVHCSVQHIAADGAPLHIQKLYDEDRVDTGDALCRRLLIDGCVVNPAGVMVRRTAYEAAGRFSEEIVWGADWHMWLRIALHNRVAYLAEPLAVYRQHPESGTSRVMATGRQARDEVWLMEDIFGEISRTRPDLLVLRRQAFRQIAHRTWCFAEDMCRRGLVGPARANLRKAVAINPAMILEGRYWALWVSTCFGYQSFQRARVFKRRLAIRSGGK